MWCAVDESGRDGWVMVAAEGGWPVGELVTVTAGACTWDGQEVGPVLRQFLVDAQAKTNADWTGAPYVVEASGIDPLPEILAGPGSAVYRIGPAGVFEVPQGVAIPVSEGIDLATLAVYYFSESDHHAGWYQGEQVVGWMVVDSRYVDEIDGEIYIVFEVNHSGVVQLGRTVELQVGGLASIEVGATGSRGRWAIVILVLLVLQSGLFTTWVRRRYTPGS